MSPVACSAAMRSGARRISAGASGAGNGWPSCRRTAAQIVLRSADSGRHSRAPAALSSSLPPPNRPSRAMTGIVAVSSEFFICLSVKRPPPPGNWLCRRTKAGRSAAMRARVCNASPAVTGSQPSRRKALSSPAAAWGSGWAMITRGAMLMANLTQTALRIERPSGGRAGGRAQRWNYRPVSPVPARIIAQRPDTRRVTNSRVGSGQAGA